MPTFNVFTDLIRPLGETLQADPLFNGIKIFYDRTKAKTPPTEIMPCITYFWVTPTEDLMRGSGAASLQLRTQKIPIGFGIWCTAQHPEDLDEQMWDIKGNLEDWLRNFREFDRKKGISVEDAITGDVDYNGDETCMIGSVLVLAVFRFYS